MGLFNWGKQQAAPADIQASPDIMAESIAPDIQMQKIGAKEIGAAEEILRKYKDGKARLEQRIVDNERWWKLRHWEAINANGTGAITQIKNADGTVTTTSADRVQPTSAWLFNSLTNKHADVMDNYPSPNVLPRERNDEDGAKALSSILPVVLERNNFEDVYSDNAWDKLKNGVCAYGVFWDPDAENGLGDIAIRAIDMLNLFWQPGVTDLQKSANLFVVSMEDNSALESRYPELKGKIGGGNIDVKQYIYDDNVDTSEKSVVIDWYYKRRSGSRTILHYCKFVNQTVLYATENDPAYAERGFYDHGKYPVFLDTLFPDKGTPAGFGFIDVMRDPQMYIDKLNQIIIENAFLNGKPRFWIKDGGGVNEDEFTDWRKSLVHVAGNMSDENIRQIDINTLPNYIPAHLEFKVNELKETSGNRDFSQGGTSGSVTAASAIAALQEAGNKLSRDMIKGSYRTYRDVVYMCVELIRQFYDEAREFRITGDMGQTEFMQFSNKGIAPQSLPPAYPGQEMEPGYQPSLRIPMFDIVVKAEKSNPFSRASQNELAKELYSMGFFDPTRAEMALGALELMDFEGKQKVMERISKGQTLMNIVQQQRAEMDKMALIIQSVTGVDMMGANQQQAGQASAQQSAKTPAKSAEGQTMNRATNNAATPLADRLASLSKPDMNVQGGMLP